MARNSEGQLTRFATGRRFVWIDLPSTSLPSMVKVPPRWQARLYYRERPKPTVTCFQCGLEGHRKGDPVCQVTVRDRRVSHSSDEGAISDGESEVSCISSETQNDRARVRSESSEEMFSEACETTVIENDQCNSNSNLVSDEKDDSGSNETEEEPKNDDPAEPSTVNKGKPSQPKSSPASRSRQKKRKEREAKKGSQSEATKDHLSKSKTDCKQMQTKISSLFHSDSRSQSRKRSGAPSPETPASAAQRFKR